MQIFEFGNKNIEKKKGISLYYYSW